MVAGFRVNENNFVPLFFKGFESLSTGIVKLAGLTNDDRPGADEHNFLDISAFRHELHPIMVLKYWR